MDLKKIKPNDVLGFLDNLISKIPDSIAKVIRNVFIGLFTFIAIYVVYKATIFGWGLAKQEGHELARDTKSIFLEEVEREYNRKRKNIKMPDSSFVEEDLYKIKKKYEPYGREIEPETISPNDRSLLEKEIGLRALKDKTPTSPLSELEESPNPSPSYKEPARQKREFRLRDNFESSSNKSSDPTLIFDNSDNYYSTKPIDKKEKEDTSIKVEPKLPNEYKNRLQTPNKKQTGAKTLLE
jgi:hypothetical protein